MQFDRLRRREFITLLGGAAVAWPLAAHAQQPAMPVIGFLSTRSRDESARVVSAFQRGLAGTGYADGQNVIIEYRWALSQYDRLGALASELVRRPVNLIVAVGAEPSALAAKAATATIPIVAIFTTDPVATGLVASLNRPGGNLTGISDLASTLEPKRLELLRKLVPQASTIAVVLNPTFPPSAQQRKDLEEAARALGVRLHILHASTDEEIEQAFASITQLNVPAFTIAVDPFLLTRREKIVALAARHAVPGMYFLRDYPLAGGLMSYGTDIADLYQQIGMYAGRVLKGDKPADLPIVLPTKFELLINLKTAKELGLAFPPGVLAIADEVIE
jgi:putative tryptophan/tyrosine transport system substrate-binding protein